MVQISLKKLTSKKEILTIIHNIVLAVDNTISIQDLEGRILIGQKNATSPNKYPINLSGEIIGWVIGSHQIATVASLISYLAQQELEKKTLASELLDKYRETILLNEIYKKIAGSLDLKDVASLVLDKIKTLIEGTHGSVMLLNEATGNLEIIAYFGEGCQPKITLTSGKGIIGNVVLKGKGEIVNDVLSDPRFIQRQAPLRSLICAPLKTKDKVIGVIEISSVTKTNYTAEDLKFLTMVAYQAASAIEMARLHEKQLSEKMSSLAQLVAGVAHEINNPVNFICGNLSHANRYTQDLLQLLELYQRYYPSPVAEIKEEAEEIDLEFLVEDLPKLLESMRVGVERISQIVLSLRNFSRLDEAEFKPVDIHQGIDGSLMLLSHRLKATAAHPSIQVIKEYGSLPLVECYAGQLNQVFLNILNNAIDALEMQPEPRIINIRTYINSESVPGSAELNPTKSTVVIRIRDNGSGMTEQVKTKVFDPFFTTKPVGKGTGLGLSISYQIVVKKHCGSLKCLSQPGEGSEFWIEIPTYPPVKPNRTEENSNL
jgi:signal transduction histidine kinase